VSGGAVAVVSRKVRDKARKFAAIMLETRPEDLAWEKGRWYMKGDPEHGASITAIAEYAYGDNPLPEGVEGGLDANAVYDPPNLTYPFGAYLVVVDIDPGTGKVKVRRFIAVNDCGVQINPMIVAGQIHGGLAEGIGQALTQIISFDDQGRCLNATLDEYLVPTALECPEHGFELGVTVTPCPHHPIGAKGVGECPGVGSGPAVANAVIDALYKAKGITQIDIPCTPVGVWTALHGADSQ
jgi:carbon-monoxide dehydrogenase large subunit